jgi:hypothetical protein
VIICLFKISKTPQTDKNRPIACTKTHVSEIIKIVTYVKRASALKYGYNSNSVTKYMQLYACLQKLSQ